MVDKFDQSWGATMLLKVNFEGGLADEHKLPAYEGIKSLEGLTRSVLIVSSFLVEGKVRRKDFGYVPIEFNLVAQQPGSFQSVYEIVYNAAVHGDPILVGLALGVAGNLLTDTLKVVFRRVTGQPDPEQLSQQFQQLQAARGGDISALVEAVEPAVRLGHNVINHGVINISVNAPQLPVAENLAEFTPATKQYVWESVINNVVRVKIFSIGSFNANQGTGRAFDIDDGRSIPFQLSDEADRISVDTLLKSISLYTRRRRLGDNLASAVAIKYTSVDSLDGRIKKIRIIAVRDEIADL